MSEYELAYFQAPSLSWSDVICELDHPGFAVSNGAGLRLLMKVLFGGLRYTPFPAELIYRHWENKEGQVGWKTLLQCEIHVDFAYHGGTDIDSN
jgi:hypothetical protein